VPPLDPRAYQKRGKFLASSYQEAQLYGRPLILSLKVNVSNPFIGYEALMEKKLLGSLASGPTITIKARLALDGRLKRAAVRLGYDSIVLVARESYRKYLKTGKLPAKIELNLMYPEPQDGARKGERAPS
jgi:hypothetical protein